MAKANKGASRSNKDKERAATLKKLGIRRTTVRCPICYHFYPEKVFPMHIATLCKGRRARPA